METFKNKYNSFLKEFGKSKTMVLSTSENNKVTSRMMSIVLIDGSFYFQTDKSFRKYSQLINNPNVALCIDNIQIEGFCKELGHPMNHPDFCGAFQESFGSSFKMYSSLKNERLFMITPTYFQRWIYEGAIPFLEVFDIEKQTYELTEYRGV